MNDASIDNTGDEQPTLQTAVKQVEQKIGRTVLTDGDILLLACNEISRTYTRDEKGYK